MILGGASHFLGNLGARASCKSGEPPVAVIECKHCAIELLPRVRGLAMLLGRWF